MNRQIRWKVSSEHIQAWKKPKLKNTERESVRYAHLFANGLTSQRCLGKNSFFSRNDDILNLVSRVRLKSISNPEYVWWSMKQRVPTPRFISEFNSPVQFLDALWTTEIRQLICDVT